MIFWTIILTLIFGTFLFNPYLGLGASKEYYLLQFKNHDNPTKESESELFAKGLAITIFAGFIVLTFVAYLVYLSFAITYSPVFTSFMLGLLFISMIKSTFKKKEKLDYRKIEDRPKLLAKCEKKKGLFDWTYSILLVVYFVHMLITLV